MPLFNNDDKTTGPPADDTKDCVYEWVDSDACEMVNGSCGMTQYYTKTVQESGNGECVAPTVFSKTVVCPYSTDDPKYCKGSS